MAVSLTVTVSQYAGNGSTSTPYPTGFRFDDAAWLRVYVTDADGVATLLVQGTDYTVTGAGIDAGGNVTTVAAYDNTNTITIARVTPRTQLLDLEYNDRLPSQLVEDALDKLTLVAQELANDKALKFPLHEPDNHETELPAPAVRKSCVLGFDAETGEAVLYELPILTMPVAPPGSGTYFLQAVDGVVSWAASVSWELANIAYVADDQMVFDIVNNSAASLTITDITGASALTLSIATPFDVPAFGSQVVYVESPGNDLRTTSFTVTGDAAGEKTGIFPAS